MENDNQENIEIKKNDFLKMSFIYSAIQNGWSVKKRKDNYIFTKKHKGKREVFLDTFLSDFIKEHSSNFIF